MASGKTETSSLGGKSENISDGYKTESQRQPGKEIQQGKILAVDYDPLLLRQTIGSEKSCFKQRQEEIRQCFKQDCSDLISIRTDLCECLSRYVVKVTRTFIEGMES